MKISHCFSLRTYIVKLSIIYWPTHITHLWLMQKGVVSKDFSYDVG